MKGLTLVQKQHFSMDPGLATASAGSDCTRIFHQYLPASIEIFAGLFEYKMWHSCKGCSFAAKTADNAAEHE